MVNSKKQRTNILRIVIFIYIVFLSYIIAMQSKQAPFTKVPFGVDSSVFKTIALTMTKGFIPYRDSFDHKGPLLYILNYLGICISYYKGIWLIELIAIFITMGGIYKIARLYCRRIYSCIILLIVGTMLFSFLDGGNLTEEYALPFISIAQFLFLDYFLNKKISSFRLIICGFSFAAVCLLRINMITLWVSFCIAVMLEIIKTKKYKRIIGFLGYFILGAGILTIPILGWLGINHALKDFWNDYIVFNQLYVGTTFIKKWNSFFNFFNNTLMLFSILSLVYFTRIKKDYCHTFYIFYYIITLLSICVSGFTYPHYGMILVPLISYPISELLSVIESLKEEKVVGILVTFWILSCTILPVWCEGITNTMNCIIERKENVHKNFDDIVNLILKDTNQEDRIIVWGNWNIIYVLTQRLPASKYSYQFPIANIKNDIYVEFFAELSINKPKYIIIQPGVELGEMENFLRNHLEYQYIEQIGGGGIYRLNTENTNKNILQ